jgi:hypothetical protein
VVAFCYDGTETLGLSTGEEFLVMAYGIRVSWFPKFSYRLTFHKNIVSEFGILSELRWGTHLQKCSTVEIEKFSFWTELSEYLHLRILGIQTFFS